MATASRPPIANSAALTLTLLTVMALSGCSVHTSVDAAGTVPANATHVWLTVDEVWLASAADTPPESTSGWTRYALATPLTIDLATLSAQSVTTLLSATAVPAGVYRQLHLVLADAGDPLSASAQAIGLTYNSQIALTDASGTTISAPLELAAPRAGLTIPMDLTLSAATPLDQSTTSNATTSIAALAITLDAARDVVSYSYGLNTGYILSAISRVDDESLSGAISGSVDASALPATHAPIYVSAESVDTTRTHHVVVQRRQVDANGDFTLYPLPAPASGTVTYDLVVSCADAQTVIVKGVPPSAAGSQSSTLLQSSALQLSSAPATYASLSAQSPALPGGARVNFFETVATAGELPYLIDGAAVDPVTHLLSGGSLALAAGPLSVGTYANGSSIGFAAVTPLQGAGNYLVGTEGMYRSDALATAAMILNGTSAATPTPAPAPSPTLAAGATAGNLTLTLTSTGSLDTGFVTVSAGGRIVETADIGTVLAAGGGRVTISGLPAGSALAASSGVAYQIAVRAWNSADPASTIVRQSAATSVNLGDSVTASLNVALL